MDYTNIKFDEKGLVPAIVQDYRTKKVLMVAYMNQESLKMTIETGKATFFSRSRQSLWVKGETSGNFMLVKEIRVDCDEDALLVLAEAKGPACHTEKTSCFYRKLDGEQIAELDENSELGGHILEEVYDVIADRKANPKEGSYTNYLFDKGIDKILKKVGEESSETIIAAKNDSKEEISSETADLFYHIMVMLADRGLTLSDVYAELAHRRG